MAYIEIKRGTLKDPIDCANCAKEMDAGTSLWVGFLMKSKAMGMYVMSVFLRLNGFRVMIQKLTHFVGTLFDLCQKTHMTDFQNAYGKRTGNRIIRSNISSIHMNEFTPSCVSHI